MGVSEEEVELGIGADAASEADGEAEAESETDTQDSEEGRLDIDGIREDVSVERDDEGGDEDEGMTESQGQTSEGSDDPDDPDDSEDVRASKGDVVAFARGAQGNPRYRKSFEEGEWWSDEAEFRAVYVEEGWTDEDGFVNKKGAAIINYADEVHDDDDGFDPLIAHLNTKSVGRFVEEAVELHEDGRFDDEGEGFTGTGSFTGDSGFF